tara:strand:- start:165 stop:650 length:486 start_codon:yes stop_codon:yes gene_type:complete
MSQISNLQENLAYLKRFSEDIQKIKLNLQTKDLAKTYDDACEDIFKNVRGICESEINSIKDSNTELAQIEQNFSNKILKAIANIKQNQMNILNKLKFQEDLMEEIMVSALSSIDLLSVQIEDIKKQAGEIQFDEPPPARTRHDLRSVGERPNKVSDTKEDS